MPWLHGKVTIPQSPSQPPPRGKICVKIARFRAGRRVAFGVARDDEIIEIRGSIFTRFRLTDNRLPLTSVTLLPPTEPSGIWGTGPNSANHPASGGPDGRAHGRAGPRPEPWHKGRNSLTGHEDPIIIPRDSDGEVHCQGEARGRHRQELPPRLAGRCRQIYLGLCLRQRCLRLDLAEGGHYRVAGQGF